MKKKTLLCTTIAGTMLVAGMAMPGVKAATVENATAIVNETDEIVAVELANGKTQLTKTEVEALVEERYADYGITVTAEVEGTLVGTGATVTLSNGKTLKVVLYGDVDGNGTVASHDLQVIADHTVENPVITDEGKLAAGDVTSSDILNSSDIQRIANYIVLAETDLVESGKLPTEVIKATTPEEVASAFDLWLENESGLNDFELDSITKYTEIPAFKTIITGAKADLAEATTVEEAEAVSKQAKADLLEAAKEYTENALETLYNQGLSDDLILTEKQYNDVLSGISSATDVADVIELYEKAVEGRLTKDDFNLMEAKAAGIEEISTYTSKVALNEGVTLDDVLTAYVEEIRAQAVEDINAVTVEEYAKNNRIISGYSLSICAKAESAIDDVYKLANKKVTDTKAFEEAYEGKMEAIEALEKTETVEEEVIAKAKAELDKIANTAREGMKNAKVELEYRIAYWLGFDSMGVVNELLSDYTTDLNNLKTNQKDYYTDADVEKLQKALYEGYDLLDTAVAGKTVEETHKTVADLSTKAKANLSTVSGVRVSACYSRQLIKEYVEGIKDMTIQSTTAEPSTEKYITAIQTTIDAELAKIDAQETGKEVMDARPLATKAIYEAMRSYLLELLNQYENLVATKDSDKVLGVTPYNNLAANKEKLTEEITENNANTTYAAQNALKILIEGFYKDESTIDVMGRLFPISAMRTEMQGLFDKLPDVAAVKAATTNVKSEIIAYRDMPDSYDKLPNIEKILNKAEKSISEADSWARFEAIKKDALNGTSTSATVIDGLYKAVDKDLTDIIAKYPNSDKQLPSDIATAQGAVRAAKTVAEKITAFEEYYDVEG